jgi:hypothetical protein
MARRHQMHSAPSRSRMIAIRARLFRATPISQQIGRRDERMEA